MKAQKTLLALSLILAAFTLPLTGLAQKEGFARESRMLMHLLKMDDAELMKLRQTVERIEAMSPEERANMRERLGKLQTMAPERRQALRQRFDAIPPEKREAMRQRWISMKPEERRQWRQKLREMSPEERADAMAEAGLIPPKQMRQRHDGEQSPRTGRQGPPPPLDE